MVDGRRLAVAIGDPTRRFALLVRGGSGRPPPSLWRELYEADAYARFVGKRLPTESEWAKAAAQDATGSMLGKVWEWTDTWVSPYPKFRAFPYVGYSQTYFDRTHRVLRGGSWATPKWALRRSFRNWYHPHRREMFAGFRCASS